MNGRIYNALNFFLFSYFGVDFSCKPETILDGVIEKAYSDATQQGAFNTLITGKNKPAEQAKKDSKEKVIKGYLDAVRSNPENYESLHKEACKNLVHNYKQQLKPNHFTYGNAQKWLNMIGKYLYLLDTIFELAGQCDSEFKRNYCGPFAKIADSLHVPVDSYIIEALWRAKHPGKQRNQANTDVDEALRDMLVEPDTLILPVKEGTIDSGAYSDSKVTAWSQWVNNESDESCVMYDKFQTSVHEHMKKGTSPIDWEGPAWIKVAKIRKKIEN